jgi:hypothetical protein
MLIENMIYPRKQRPDAPPLKESADANMRSQWYSMRNVIADKVAIEVMNRNNATGWRMQHPSFQGMVKNSQGARCRPFGQIFDESYKPLVPYMEARGSGNPGTLWNPEGRAYANKLLQQRAVQSTAISQGLPFNLDFKPLDAITQMKISYNAGLQEVNELLNSGVFDASLLAGIRKVIALFLQMVLIFTDKQIGESFQYMTDLGAKMQTILNEDIGGRSGDEQRYLSMSYNAIQSMLNAVGKVIGTNTPNNVKQRLLEAIYGKLKLGSIQKFRTAVAMNVDDRQNNQAGSSVVDSLQSSEMINAVPVISPIPNNIYSEALQQSDNVEPVDVIRQISSPSSSRTSQISANIGPRQSARIGAQKKEFLGRIQEANEPSETYPSDPLTDMVFFFQINDIDAKDADKEALNTALQDIAADRQEKNLAKNVAVVNDILFSNRSEQIDPKSRQSVFAQLNSKKFLYNDQYRYSFADGKFSVVGRT